MPYSRFVWKRNRRWSGHLSFWDNDDKCRIQQKMEGLNDILGDVYVLLQRSEVEGAPKWRCLDDGSHVVDPSHQQATKEGSPHIEEDNEDQFVEPLGSSWVMGSTWNNDSLDHQMKSTLVPNDMWEQNLEHVEKMKRDFKCSLQEDNQWVLKS
jgi:hypothetical protein